MSISVTVPLRTSSPRELTVTSAVWSRARERMSSSSTLMVTDMLTSGARVRTSSVVPLSRSSSSVTEYTVPEMGAVRPPYCCIFKSSSSSSSVSLRLWSRES